MDKFAPDEDGTMNKIPILFLLSMILATGCYDNSDCGDEFSSSLRISFFRIINSDSIVSAAPPLVRVTALGAKQVLYDSADRPATERMSFPVNIYSDTTLFYFDLPGRSETVQVVSSRRQMLINPECGVTQSLNLDTAFTTFDSIRITNKFLRYSDTTRIHLEVYY